MADCEVVHKKTNARVTEAEIEEAMRASKGIITAAGAWLAKNKRKRISQQGLSARIAKSERLQQVRLEIDEATLDFVESKLFELLNKGDKTAIIFYLKCKGKNRGYVERSEIVGKDGAPVQFTLVDIMTKADAVIKNNQKKNEDNEEETEFRELSASDTA